MGISAIETLCPHRYAANPGAGLLIVQSRLVFPGHADAPENTVQLTLAVVDMFDTERSRGALAMEAAAWLQGMVTLQRLGHEVSLGAISQLVRSGGSEYLMVVVWVPHERLHLLDLGDHVPGVGMPGLPMSCIVVTDEPGAVSRSGVDLLVGTRADPIADAVRVTRLLSSLHASETIVCADILDFAGALAGGSHAVCVDVFWSEGTPEDIQFGGPEDALLLAETSGAVMTMCVPHMQNLAWRKAPLALRRRLNPDASWQYQIATGQRVDHFAARVCQLDALCAVPPAD